MFSYCSRFNRIAVAKVEKEDRSRYFWFSKIMSCIGSARSELVADRMVPLLEVVSFTDVGNLLAKEE